jgi:hypothetical protein
VVKSFGLDRAVVRRKILCSCRKSKPGRPTRNLLTIVTALSRLLQRIYSFSDVADCDVSIDLKDVAERLAVLLRIFLVTRASRQVVG